MQILTLLAQKGGTGKTTLSIHLAVLAMAAGQKAAIADIDPQQSALFWKKRRALDNPVVLGINATDLDQTIVDLKTQGTDLLIIDTAPHSWEDALLAVKAADSILIPTRPAILDLEAIRRSVDIVKTAQGKGAIVLNGCPYPGPGGERAIVSEARDALQIYGLPVAPMALSNRVAFSHSLIDGRAVTEFEKTGKAALEIRALYDWLKENLW
ncbi:AAA family ATPase [uncultured Desulfobacter sp.]|uniref:AAA family ATPase n=1 Tax=uncultured Desulfobacter sp. TaxID=240139 RepID=UPI0029F5A116|nr:AAA family ATPase [uncultured Desulfobacter sp.]